LETFLLRRQQLAVDVRNYMARRIAPRVSERLKILNPERQSAEALLEKLVNEYRNSARFR